MHSIIFFPSRTPLTSLRGGAERSIWQLMYSLYIHEVWYTMICDAYLLHWDKHAMNHKRCTKSWGGAHPAKTIVTVMVRYIIVPCASSDIFRMPVASCYLTPTLFQNFENNAVFHKILKSNVFPPTLSTGSSQVLHASLFSYFLLILNVLCLLFRFFCPFCLFNHPRKSWGCFRTNMAKLSTYLFRILHPRFCSFQGSFIQTYSE